MKHTIARIAALSIMILLFLTPTHAQDATQEATVEAAPIAIVGEGTTVEDGGVNVTVNNPAPTETPANNATSGNSFTVLIGVLVAGFVSLVVAVSYGLQTIGNRAASATSNPFETVALEKLGDGVPSAVVIPLTSALERATEALSNITKAWKEATDKTPAASKPAMPYAVNASGTSIPNSATPTQNLTSLHDMAGGAGPAGGDAFRE